MSAKPVVERKNAGQRARKLGVSANPFSRWYPTNFNHCSRQRGQKERERHPQAGQERRRDPTSH